MKKSLLLTVAACVLFCTAVFSQETPRWLRQGAISPDGSTIAFCYQGDIFTVSASGGEARQITSSPAYEADPLWSPDGKSLVFSSMREGTKDVWTVSSKGGAPVRLTTFPGAETPLTVTPDGYVLFSANILPSTATSAYPGDSQLYKVPLTGGHEAMVASLTVSNISVAADGTALYEDYKGYEDPLRKHHTSSVTRDVWLWNIAGGQFKQLSKFEGENRNPVFAPDGKSFYYLSEKGGNFNVWKGSLDGTSEPEQLSKLPTHPVRYLSVSADGLMLFSYNGDLYTMREGAEPAKLDITVVKDNTVKEKIRRTVSGGATGIAPSPNGKELAIESRGDIFVTSIDNNYTRRITCTPERERGLSFSPDGRELYYAAERNGHWGIWKSSLKNKDDKYFTLTYDIEEERVTAPGVTCTYPSVSPDGKYLAFFRDRTEIVVRDLKSGKEKSVFSGALYSYSDGDLDFEWSPDSRYLLSDSAADGGWNNNDVALIDVESGEITNLTRCGYSDGGFRWALGGKAMTWISDRAGYRSHGSWGSESDIYIMFFNGEAYYKFTRDKDEDAVEKLLKENDKKAQKQEAKDSVKAEKGKVDKLVLDLVNREDRIVRLTPGSGRLGDHFLTPDGTSLYYVQRLEKGFDLCQLDIKKKSVKVIEKGISGEFYPSKDGKVLFIPGQQSIKKFDIASGKSTSVTFTDEYDYYPAAEREYILAHVWKQVKEKFYDPTIHGIDWDGFYANYATFLPYIDNNYDFRELLSEMLGELNASHTGGRYRPGGAEVPGRLGVLYDDTYDGPGLKIAEILPGSCLAMVKPDIKAGDIIFSVNGKDIAPGTPWYIALEHKAGKKTMLGIRSGRKDSTVTVQPAGSDAKGLYKRWVRSREKLVEQLSGGRIGYVHVKDMDSDSFREVFSNALGKYRTCEALIVDTRHNGGGWLHDDLATFLNGKAYADFKPRGQYIGTEPYSKWTKPSCVLVCEDNYSDASGFPFVYRQMGIGKIIGAPVPGTMTAVWWETQIDPTLVFGIPQVTVVSRADGSILENQQLEPDILVYNDPASVLRGEDKQLEAAVNEMLKQISANK